MGLSVSGLGFRLQRWEVLGGLECRALWVWRISVQDMMKL